MCIRDRFNHLTVSHGYNFVNPVSGAHTHGIENTVQSFKQENIIECGTRRELIESYLYELMW